MADGLTNISKTIRYFFLVVALSPRRVLKTFSEKNTIFVFVKKIEHFFF